MDSRDNLSGGQLSEYGIYVGLASNHASPKFLVPMNKSASKLIMYAMKMTTAANPACTATCHEHSGREHLAHAHLAPKYREAQHCSDSMKHQVNREAKDDSLSNN
jgi:hypothetical protein